MLAALDNTALLEEKTPLLVEPDGDSPARYASRSQASLSKRLSNAVFGTIRIIVSTLAAPGRYIVACFYDEQGHFSAVLPVYRLGRSVFRKRRKHGTVGIAMTSATGDEKEEAEHLSRNRPKRRPSRSSSGVFADDVGTSTPTSSTATMNGMQLNNADDDTPSRHTRSKSILDQVSEDSEDSSLRRSTRIKIVNQDVLRQRKQRREQRELGNSASHYTDEPLLTVDTIKSPTSSMSAARLDKYPRTPAPPRPLVPRRQPSYTASNPALSEPPQKTLIIDLDETLIHSMAKGGRMSTGHMVEVKLDSPVGVGGGVIGPQVPILYYVHKRPHCDEFLRKVSKWYNLIVFTASVQEYADPVIDWLELERKFFTARYYRQHCTYRSGAYIKDLGKVEPDLSKVMILDNSPLSYLFHEDNAIPIEGWISDPTDNDLLNIIPLLEGLQHTTDVRALLALRLGEPKV